MVDAYRSISRRAWLGSVPALLAAGCATPPPPAATAAAEWHDVPLPGKRRTEYRWERLEGRSELVARADRSSSMYRRRVAEQPGPDAAIEFAWWVQSLPVEGDVSNADTEDAAARVLLAFGGDHGRLSPRNQMMFELARALTGEAPPYAMLGYVWDVKAPVGSTVVHPRSDRVRKIIVESGPAGLRQWRSYRRSVRDDFQRAFGEAPGPLLAVAVMTDGDNTGSTLFTRYRDIRLR